MSWLPFFSTRTRPRTVEVPPLLHNLLLVSDLHMGEDIAEFGSSELLKYIQALNDKFSQFLHYFAHNTQQGRPWHLVANGDTFDFLKLSLRKAPPKTDSEWIGRIVEEVNKTDNTPKNLAWKMRRICEVHLPVMEALAIFIEKGHKLTIVVGNHDTELYFSEVQQALKEFILERVQHRLHVTGHTPFNEQERNAFTQRITFERWFIAQAGDYHIEHGHLYDQYCSLEFPLLPLDKAGSSQIAIPIGQKAMPFFADLLADFSTHGMEKVGFVAFMKMALSKRLRFFWAMVRTYVLGSEILLRRVGVKRHKEIQALATAHRRELKSYASHIPYSFATLKAINSLRKRPVEFSFWRTALTFYLDRFYTTLGLLGLGIFAVVSPFSIELRAMLLSGGILGYILYTLISMRLRRQDTVEDLYQAAVKIAHAAHPRYIVFGHSHVAEHRPIALPNGKRTHYFNSGSWVTREVVRGKEGEGMTFIALSANNVALCKWIGDNEQQPYLHLAKVKRK